MTSRLTKLARKLKKAGGTKEQFLRICKDNASAAIKRKQKCPTSFIADALHVADAVWG